MTSHKNITYAVALAGALTLALAGCNGGEDDPTATSSPTGSSSSTTSTSPSSSGSPSGSATGSATPSPSVSVSVPAAARANTAEGATAFAQWVIEQADMAYVSLDDSVFKSLGDASCEGCASVVKDVRDLRASGYHQKGRAVTVDDALPIDGGLGRSTIDLLVSVKVVPYVHSSGVEKGSTKAEKRRLRLIARWADGVWRIQNFAEAA